MAVYTSLSEADAAAVATQHALGGVRRIEPIAAGSVNSNYFLETERGRFFLRIYEEQEAEGVEFEWSLLDHLQAKKVPVPRRVQGAAAGRLRVAGKPTAVFELIGGQPIHAADIDEGHAAAVGTALAQVHMAGADFPRQHASRFDLAGLQKRLQGIAAANRPELLPVVVTLQAVLDDAAAQWPVDLPQGIIHGDLFPDNVTWEGTRIANLIDWESASSGLFAYDLMITVLAWCCDEDIEWSLARALLGAYERVRPLQAREAIYLHRFALVAAARFTITRLSDSYLRDSMGQRVYLDYRVFLRRLERLGEMDAKSVRAKLLGR